MHRHWLFHRECALRLEIVVIESHNSVIRWTAGYISLTNQIIPDNVSANCFWRPWAKSSHFVSNSIRDKSCIMRVGKMNFPCFRPFAQAVFHFECWVILPCVTFQLHLWLKSSNKHIIDVNESHTRSVCVYLCTGWRWNIASGYIFSMKSKWTCMQIMRQSISKGEPGMWN